MQKTDIVHTCVGCLGCLLLYDTECLNAIIEDSDRVKTTLMSMKKKVQNI